MRQELITELNTFVDQKKYEELKQYIMESDSDKQSYINIELFSLVAQKDDLFEFLLEISNIDGSSVFNYNKEYFFANVYTSSCYDAEDIKWFIKKMKEHNLTPIQIIQAARKMFGCGEIGDRDLLYLEMLSGIY